MKSGLIICSLLIFQSIAFSQNLYPTILVLSPYKTVMEAKPSKSDAEMKDYAREMVEKEIESTKTPDFELRTENIKLITKARTDFFSGLSIETYPTYLASDMLTYRILHYSDYDESGVVVPSLLKCPNHLDSLKKISSATKNRFVINFSEVRNFQKKGKYQTEISIQVYDSLSNKIILNETAVGKADNEGFEYTCTENSMRCSINGAFSDVEQEILGVIGKNLSNKEEVENVLSTRTKILQEKVSKINTAYLDAIFDFKSRDIDPSSIFFQLFNSDSSELIILTLDDVRGQSTFFDFSGNKYSAFKYNNRWYIDEGTKSLFPGENLESAKQSYLYQEITDDYFIERTSTVNPDFWEIGAFEKVELNSKKHQKEIEALKKYIEDPNSKAYEKEKCKTRLEWYEKEDNENHEYEGMYVAVAEELKEKKRNEMKVTDQNFRNEFVAPFYSSFSKKNGYTSMANVDEKEPEMIFNTDKTVFIIPTAVTTAANKPELYYFVFIKNPDNTTYDIYQWTFFKEKTDPKNQLNWMFHSQINTIDLYPAQLQPCANERFWNNRVLIKENNVFKYLKKVS